MRSGPTAPCIRSQCRDTGDVNLQPNTIRVRTGILLAAGTAGISGFAVFVNGYGVRAWASVSDPTTYTTFKNLVAALVLIAAGSFAYRWKHADAPVRPRSSRQWFGLIIVAIVGGSLPFALFFEGLARASSTQAALIHKSLVVWVALLAVIFLRERVRPPHLVAVAVLVWGQIELAGGLSGLGLGSGELMILAATLLWSVEVTLAKRLLADLPSMTLGIARMGGGTAVLLGYGLGRGAFGDLAALGWSHWGWVLVTGLVLSAYVGTWFAALARAPALDVTAVLVAGAILTAFLQTGIRGLPAPPALGTLLVLTGSAVAALTAWRRRELVM